MFCTLLLDGVPLGQAELRGAPRAVGLLTPLDGYVATGFHDHAKRLGTALFILGSSRVDGRAAARSLAGALANFHELQSRLSLLDIRGGHVAIAHIVVAEFPHDDVPVIVAELREQASAVPARIKLPRLLGADASRPAA